MVIPNAKDWDKNRPTLASFWEFAIGILIAAYLLRLYTRSRLYKSITRRIIENARKRNPDLEDEALPTRAIIRQVLVDMDVIVYPSVDAIFDSFLWPNPFPEVARAWGMIPPFLRWTFFLGPSVVFFPTSITTKNAPTIALSTLAIASTLWCQFLPRFFSYSSASITYCVLWSYWFANFTTAPAIAVSTSLGTFAVFLAILGMNLSYNEDLAQGPKYAFERVAWEAVMRNLPELLFVTIPLGIPIALVSAPWPYQPDWELWQILLADNLIVIISAWFFHRLLRKVFGNSHRPLLYKVLYCWAIVGGVPISLLWTYNPAWPRFIPLSTTALVLYVLGTISFMDYKLLGPLEYEELYMIGAMFYLAAFSLPWLLFWYGEIRYVDTHWGKGHKIGAACGVNFLEGFLFWLSVFIARRLKRTRGRKQRWNRP